jgi:3-phosphoshikimate 1-carboxyvinyltransferase
MNSIVIDPGKIDGGTSIPPSKSQTHRALIFASMAKGASLVHNILKSPDTDALMEALKLIGVRLTQNGEQLHIEGLNGSIQEAENILDLGNSGIALRFLTALAALSPRPIVLTGDHSLRNNRPMNVMMDALCQLGVRAESLKKNGYAPIVVKGLLEGGKATLDGHDSQPVSALIIASLFSDKGVELTIKNSGEHPWVDLTLEWLDRLNLKYEREGYGYYRIPGKQRFKGFEYTVPADWSSAAFPAAAALVTGGKVILKNVRQDSNQGDKKLFDFFRAMGAQLRYDENEHSLEIFAEKPLRGISVDINECIDAITILAVVACYAEGETHIYNGAVAREKECDRIHCITRELSKMGAIIKECDDGLIIQGSPLKGASLSSYGDHRMAMSLIVAALGATGRSSIDQIDCVKKTYPSFISEIKRLGAQIQ